MLLPSLLLPPSLLNATTATVTIPGTPSSPTPSSSTVHCLQSVRGHIFQPHPVTWVACKEALSTIPISSDSLKPILFSRDPRAGFQVPYSWRSGECVVEIDVAGEGMTETATFAALMVAAFDLAVGCVMRRPHLGGKVAVGEEEGLEVFMYGVRV